MVNGKPLFNMVVPNISVRSMTHNLCCYWLTAVDQAIQTLSPIPLLLKKVRALFSRLFGFTFVTKMSLRSWQVCFEASVLSGTKRLGSNFTYRGQWFRIVWTRLVSGDANISCARLTDCFRELCLIHWRLGILVTPSYHNIVSFLYT